jgi:glycosyltransferase involved in cell wall biosynthesis
MRGAMFHASSELEGEELRDMGWSRVVVVPHAVNAHEFAGRAELNVREVLGLPSDAKLVVSVSRFDPVKNLMTLVDATEALGVHLVLAGNHQNNYGRTLRRAIEDRRRGDVHAVGYVEGEMKRALLQQANAYVCASLVESYGVSIAEALASGCPVVASTGTPWEGLQQAGAGRWVPPNAGAIRAGLVEVLGGPASQRERARELARKHDWKTRVRPMLDLYRAAIAAAREGQVGPQ